MPVILDQVHGGPKPYAPFALPPSPAVARPGARHGALPATVILVLIVAVAAGLRLHQLGYLSLWTDEVFSRYYYRLGLRYLWTEGLAWESSPPLYYMAAGAWMQLFGDSDATLRSLSVAASLATLPLAYLIGRETLGQRAALLGTALLALAPDSVFYAQQARPYALLVAWLCLCLLGLVRIMGGRWRGSLALYVAGAVLALYTHTTSTFVIAACGLVGAVPMLRGPGTRPLLTWIGAHALLVLLALPALAGSILHVEEQRLAWIPPLARWQFLNIATEVVAGPWWPDDAAYRLLPLLLLGLLALALLRRPPPLRAAAVLVVVPLLFLGMVVAASLFQPILLGRVFGWTEVPFCLLLGHALLQPGWARRLLAPVLLLAFGLGLHAQFHTGPNAKEPWRDVVERIRPALDRGTTVVLGPETIAINIRQYAPEGGELHTLASDPPGRPDRIVSYIFPTPEMGRTELARRIAAGEETVMVLRSLDLDSLAPMLEGLPTPAWRLDWTFRGTVRVAVLGWNGRPDEPPGS
ncbi:glycosyltransferase family 39 protein [Roseomonas sp. NAR14]|uniref:Glycosyltransferase family 39 protein n=1 Tax=Roseomonas acroporae TaxID=2937791 RepID=A0A9X1Y985_9PROT|nr:glycosyltransferase family 39 protein [Roseomonas acroporae]MCK8785425.1 glycosyltransferase family 39 protein [Roseomonas acroporae]